eukprot:35152_1
MNINNYAAIGGLIAFQTAIQNNSIMINDVGKTGGILLSIIIVAKIIFKLITYSTRPSFGDDKWVINTDILENVKIVGKHASEIHLNDIDAACNEMRQIYKSNITRKLSNRKVQLQNLSKLLAEKEEELINALYEDLGRDRMLAITGDLILIKTAVKNFLANLEKLNSPRRIQMSINSFPAIEYDVQEPYGTVFISDVWNYPFILLFRPLAAAIAAGNNVVVKPCNTGLKCSELITNLLHQYMDPHFVQVIGGPEVCNGDDHKITDKILDNKFDFIFFTGSTNGGKYIMSKAAKFLTPVLLELGGKNPTIIDESANIDKAVTSILVFATANCGQTCFRPDYVLCHKDKINEFCEKSRKKLNEWFKNYGNKYVGKIVNNKQFDRVIEMLKNTKGEIIHGGKYNKDKLQIDPTIIKVNNWNDCGMKQETFGPILWVKEVNDIVEAVNYVNNQEKPLSLYMFSENKANQNYVISNTSSGAMEINSALPYLNPNVAFGGVGSSGTGAYGGNKTFYLFFHTKPVVKKLLDLVTTMLTPPRDGWKEKIMSYVYNYFV